MRGREIVGPTSGRQLNGHFSHNAQAARSSSCGIVHITREAVSVSNPVTETPRKLSGSRPLRKAKAVHHDLESLRSEPIVYSRGFGKHKRATKLDKSDFPGPSLGNNSLQLFYIQPIITGPGEEELHFDLDPR